MATEQILLLRLLADMKQPVQSFAELETRLKTLRTSLKNTPNEGTRGFDQLAKEISGKLGISVDQARQKIVKFQKDATSEIRKGTNQLKEYRRTLRTIEPAANSINAMRQSVRSLSQEVDNLDRNTEEFASKNKQLRKLNSELIKIEKTTLRGGRNVGNYETAFRGLGRTLSGVAASLGIGFGVAGLSRIVQDGVKVFSDFNQQIALLEAISGASKEEIKQLEDQAKRLGETTQFTAQQVAELQTNLARLGFTTSEIKATTAAVLDLSIATGEDLAESAKVTGQTIRAFGLQATDSRRVTDALTEAFNSSALKLNTYAEAYKLFAPVARSLKIPFEEAAAAIGIYADQGLEGTIATTALSTSFLRLSKASSRQAKAARDMGVEVFNANGEFVGLSQLIKNLEKQLGDLNDESKLGAIAEIFDARAVKNINALIGAQKEVNGEIFTGGEALEKYTKQLEGAEGAAKSAAEIVGDTFAQDMLKLKSAIQGAAIQFVEMNEGGLREFIQFLTAAVPVLANNVGLILRVAAALALYIARQQVAGVVTIATTAAQKGLSVASAILTGKLNLTTLATERLNKAMAKNPIGLAVFAATTLIFALIELYNRSERFKAAVDNLWESLKRFLNTNNEIAIAGKALKGIWDLLVDSGRALGIVLASILKGLLDFIKESHALNAPLRLLVGLFSNMSKLIDDSKVSIIGFLSQSREIRSLVLLIEKIIEGWDSMIFYMGNAQAFIAGLSAEVKDFLKFATRDIELFSINAEIALRKLQKLNPFASLVDLSRLDVEINKLRFRKSTIEAYKKAGTKFGTAFTKAYDEALEAYYDKQAELRKKAEEDAKKAGGLDDDTNKGGKKPFGGPSEDDLTTLEKWQKLQKELAEDIKNRIAEQRDYSEQLKDFLDVTEKLTKVEEEYAEATKKGRDFAEGSTQAYTESIKKLQKELSKLTIGSAEYLEKERMLNELLLERKEKLETAIALTREYTRAIFDLNTKIGEGEEEINAVTNAIGRLNNVSSAGPQGAKEIQKIQEDLERELDRIATERLNKRKDNALSEIEEFDKLRDNELDQAEGNEEMKEAIRNKWRKRRAAKELEVLDVTKELLDRELKAFKEKEKKKTDELKKEEDKRKQIIEGAFRVANELSGALVESLQRNADQYYENQGRILDREEERLLENADRVGATEEQKQAIRERFAKEREELEREAANKRKEIAVIEAALNVALAVTKALTTLAPPASFVQAGITAALGAIQIATIKAAQFALGGFFDMSVQRGSHPSFGRGAYLDKGLYHTQGGMPIINPITGQKVAEIEKDEGILNKKIMRTPQVFNVSGTPYEIASMLNSYKGWGVPFPKRNVSGRAIMKNIGQGQIKRVTHKHGGLYGINRSIPKMQAGAVFGSDIAGDSSAIRRENEKLLKAQLIIAEEIRDLKQSNRAALQEMESTAATLKRLNQYKLDEQNAS